MKLNIKIASLLITATAALLFSCNQPGEKTKTIVPASTTAEPATVKQNKQADKNLLLGNWVRTDAPYQITISAVEDDGNLKAGYFNPNSINVYKALWNNEDGFLKVYIELRDKNYPGSNYKLNYDEVHDALTGEYFQAVEGNTYNVAFLRAN